MSLDLKPVSDPLFQFDQLLCLHARARTRQWGGDNVKRFKRRRRRAIVSPER